MLELYSSLNTYQIMTFMVVSMLGIVPQTAYAINMRLDKRRNIFEMLILLHMLITSLVFRKLNSAIASSMIININYVKIRWIIGVLIFIYSLYYYFNRREKNIIYGGVLVLLTLPMMEELPYGVFTSFYILSLIFLILRASILFINQEDEKEYKISQNSIKEALDTLDNGILFIEDNGNLILFNKQILRLMKEISGRYYRNGILFWDYLLKNGSLTLDNDSQVRIGLDSETWQFNKSEINYGSKKAYQIIAVDVTELEDIIKNLKYYDMELSKQRDELKIALENIHELKREEAISRFWEHIHATLGQYLSILQRLLRENPYGSRKEFNYLTENIKKDLISIRQPNPEELYEDMVASFASLDINLYREGSMPKDSERANLFMDIIREGVNNAIRHGQAKNIYIGLVNKNNKNTLVISSDGRLSPKDISWGGGFTNIDKRLKDINGNLEIITRPDFTLYIEVEESTISR